MGQFMRDFGDDLAGFHVGEDAEMNAVSANGQGPPDGWTFSSWTTLAQLQASAGSRWQPSRSGEFSTNHCGSEHDRTRTRTRRANAKAGSGWWWWWCIARILI